MNGNIDMLVHHQYVMDLAGMLQNSSWMACNGLYAAKTS